MNVEGKSLALLILSGNQEGRILPLVHGEELLIGRMDGLDLVLPEDLVSRRHARIEVGEQGAVLRDLGSTNGTFVNGKRIREIVLAEGDRILLGATIMSVVPHEEMLLPSGGSLTEVLAAVSAGPPMGDELDGEETGEESLVEGDLGEEAPSGEARELSAGPAEPEAPLPPEARLAIAEGAPPLRTLAPEELDLLQAALLGQPVARLLEQAEGVEDAPALLRGLVDRGYLRIVA